MHKIIISPGYFAPIDMFAAYLQADEVFWEVEDHYQKQTYRNRQYIYGPNGKLLLNIPIDHQTRRSHSPKYKEVKIENEYAWQRTHWRSLQTAYRNSPFFEFYEHELIDLYQKKFDYLLDFNFACVHALKSCLQINKTEQTTKEYLFEEELKPDYKDFRSLIIAKRAPSTDLKEYEQVFQEKYGFYANLSVLDLLFNLGPESLSYLSKVDF